MTIPLDVAGGGGPIDPKILQDPPTWVIYMMPQTVLVYLDIRFSIILLTDEWIQTDKVFCLIGFNPINYVKQT